MGFVDDTKIVRSEFARLTGGEDIVLLSEGYQIDYHFIDTRFNQSVKKSVAYMGNESKAVKEGYSKRSTYYYLALLTNTEMKDELTIVEVKQPIIFDMNGQLRKLKKELEAKGDVSAAEIERLTDKRTYLWHVWKEGEGRDNTRWGATLVKEFTAEDRLAVDEANGQLETAMHGYQESLVGSYHEIFTPQAAQPAQPSSQPLDDIDLDNIPF